MLAFKTGMSLDQGVRYFRFDSLHFMRHLLIPLLAFLSIGPVSLLSAAERVALVIGNDAYRHGAPLKNCVNDARAVSEALVGAGFDVVVVENAGLQEIEAKVLDFQNRARGAKAAWFHYSGHGMELRGSNYLVPVDADVKEEFQVKHKTYPLEQVMGALEGAETPLKVVVLDCCRDNPLGRGWNRSGGAGLAQVGGTPAGTIIAYATSPGMVAADGAGANSPFTAALIGAMKVPGIEIEQMFKQTGRLVLETTGKKQQPWVNSSFFDSFVLHKAETGTLEANVMSIAGSAPQNTQDSRPASEAEALRLAVLTKPPRSVLIEIAKSDQSEAIRLYAARHLAELKVQEAVEILWEIHRTSKDPEVRWTTACELWEHFEIKKGAAFLLKDFQERGRYGPVIKWDAWTDVLIEMQDPAALKEFKAIWDTSYNRQTDISVKRQMIHRLGIPYAAYDDSQVAVIRERLRKLPADERDESTYLALAALGDEYSMARLRKALSAEKPPHLTFNIPISRKSHHAWSLGLREVEACLAEGAKKTSNPGNCVKLLSEIARDRAEFGEESTILADLRLDYPPRLFFARKEHDGRIQHPGGEPAHEPQLWFAENWFDEYSPLLAEAGNRDVVNFSEGWLNAPDPGLRFRACMLASMYLNSLRKPLSEADSKLAVKTAAVVDAMWQKAPLLQDEVDFGIEPGKLDLIRELTRLDKGKALVRCRELMQLYEVLPSVVVDEEAIFDPSEKRIVLRPVPNEKDRHYSNGNWENSHTWYKEQLAFSLIYNYASAWEEPDIKYIDYVCSFEFVQAIARQGGHANKSAASLWRQSIDSVQLVTARVHYHLASAGYHAVYPKMLETLHFREQGAMSDMIRNFRMLSDHF